MDVTYSRQIFLGKAFYTLHSNVLIWYVIIQHEMIEIKMKINGYDLGDSNMIDNLNLSESVNESS